MRLFLAINLEPHVQGALGAATAPLAAAAPSLRWSREARLHLTLKFLGEQPDDAAATVAPALADVTRRHKPFAMRIGGVGAFPNFRRPRVVWMGVAPDPRLELLHHDVEVACERLGFPLDGRPFRPHITLARVKDAVPAAELKKLRAASDAIGFDAESAVSSVDVMRSVPGANARYERLHAAGLRHA